MKIGFIGTYTTRKSKGIYKFTFDENSGKVEKNELFIEISSPKYIFIDDKFLYTVCKFEENAGVSVFDFDGNLVDKLAYEKTDSCHIAKFSDYIYTANYHSGEVSKIRFINGKLELVATRKFKEKAGCHQVISDGEYLYAFCLNLDKIYVLNFDLSIKTEINFPKGSGVRHGIFVKKNDILYAVSELSGEVFTIEKEGFKIINSSKVIDYDDKNSIAAVRLSEDEKFLYVSTRGDDSISVFDVSNTIPSLVQIKKSGGKHPRDFMIFSDKFLLAVNRDSDNLCVFKLNCGKIGEKVCEVYMPEAISVVLKGE